MPLHRRARCLPFQSGWRSKTTTLIFPPACVILPVSHHFEDKDLLVDVQDAGYQAIIIALDVENDAISDAAGIAEACLDIAP